jgi:hypothetical protein
MNKKDIRIVKLLEEENKIKEKLKKGLFESNEEKERIQKQLQDCWFEQYYIEHFEK